MFTKAIAVVVLLCGSAGGPAAADGFAGKWEVTEVVTSNKDGFDWSLEVKYPKHMTLELRNGRLAGHYTDQWKYSSEFELVAVINQGHDLLLVHGGAGTKNPEALSPVHHVKLVKGKLHAVVTSGDKLFEWIAVRK
ncbi:MAG TPA: hypothetical protein VK595_08920 [Vicinamibacterales bacterium]|jgi:hypothetical protein|nr:hypothetical protein [Vicinamibacterales bacterium]